MVAAKRTRYEEAPSPLLGREEPTFGSAQGLGRQHWISGGRPSTLGLPHTRTNLLAMRVRQGQRSLFGTGPGEAKAGILAVYDARRATPWDEGGGGQAQSAAGKPGKRKSKKRKGEGEGADEARDEPAETPAIATPPPQEPVDTNNTEWTGERLAAVARAAMKSKASFAFGFDVDESAAAAADAPGGTEARAANATAPAAESRTVYVGGLPYDVTDVEVEQRFAEVGCAVASIERLAFADSGRFRGIAFVTFDSARAAKRAIAQTHGQAFAPDSDRFLTVKKFEPQGGGHEADGGERVRPAVARTKGYHRVYVGNLPWECTQDALRAFFEAGPSWEGGEGGEGAAPHCRVKFLRLGEDKATGEFRGFAHAHFASAEDVDRALALNGSHFLGRQIKVSCAIPPKR